MNCIYHHHKTLGVDFNVFIPDFFNHAFNCSDYEGGLKSKFIGPINQRKNFKRVN